MSCDVFPLKLALPLSMPRVLMVKNDKIFVFAPSPGPKSQDPVTGTGQLNRVIIFLQQLQHISPQTT